MLTRIISSSTLVALGISVSAQALSQESTAPAARMIEEVIVTATRREEGAQTVPVSVNAFSTQMLEDRNVRELGDLTRIAPGIRFVHQGDGGNMNVVLRGLSRIPIGTAPSAVINYFADVPLSYKGSNIPTFDLASIQVLKGPQGTLFGRNALGGAVVITPQAPTHDFGGYLKASGGNHDFKDVEGAVNIPLVEDKVALRVGGKVSRRDGYTKNLGVGDDMDDVHRDSYRVSLLIEPTASFSNTTIYDYMEAREAGAASVLTKVLDDGLARAPGIPLTTPPDLTFQPGSWLPLAPVWNCKDFDPVFNPAPCTGFRPDADLDDALIQQKAWGPYKTVSEYAPNLYRELWGVTNRTEWDVGPFTLRNILAYREVHVDSDVNADGLPWSPFGVITATMRTNTKQLSNEFHLFGEALDNKLDYLIGAFYIDEEPDGPNGDLFPIIFPTAPWVHAYTEKTNKAAFAQVGYEVLGGVRLVAGYRYNETDSEVCAVSAGNTTIVIDPQPPVSAGACKTHPDGSTIQTTEYASTWNLGIDWQINDALFAYVARRKGYREGGINAPLFNTPASAVLAPYQLYGPEEIKDIEVGLKSDFALGDVPLRFNIAVYESKYSNVLTAFNASNVVPSTDLGSPQASSLAINIGERTLRGFESELIAEILDNLTITHTVAYLHQQTDKESLPPIPGLDASTTLKQATPRWATAIAARWLLPIQPLDGQVAFNIDYYWQDSYHVATGELPSYDLLNLRLDWSNIANSGVDLGFFMRNVLDDDSPYAGGATTDSLGLYTMFYQEPRMYGLEVSYRFGN